jgi:GNAT superfamily N-acetyltransferase
MEIKIKKAKLSDAESFAKINEVIWGTPATKSIIDYFIKGISCFRDGYYLAESEGVFVGSSEGFPIKEKLPISMLAEIEDPVDLFCPEGRYYYVHIIQVYPEFRNRGVGDMLLKTQINVARGLYIPQVCGIAISNQLDHWIKSGFSAEGQAWETYKNFGLFKWVSMDPGQS